MKQQLSFSDWRVIPVLAALAVAIGALGAPDAAQAVPCTADNCPACDVATIVTMGKGQSAAVNAHVTHTITGSILDPASLGGTAHRIPICLGTPVTVVVTNDDTTNSRSLSIDDRAPLGFTQTDEMATASFEMPAVKALYIATNKVVAGGGSDTDRMTLLPRGVAPIGEIGSHQCVLDASSGILLDAAAVHLELPLSGSADVTCGVPDLITSKAACNCTIEELAPIPIGGLGRVCVTPATQPCDPGEIDCDGGNLLDVEAVSDHNIGTCAGNCSLTTGQQCDLNTDCPAGSCSISTGTACRRSFECPTTETCVGAETCVNGQAGCEPSCQAYCTALGLDFVSAGCEGFCTEGTGRACTQDALCAFFEEGSCAGSDAPPPQFVVPHQGICGCQCGRIDGASSRAGALLCNLGAAIKVVPLMATCDAPATINVGEACIPLTTEAVDYVVLNANDLGACVGGSNDGANCFPGNHPTLGPAQCQICVGGNEPTGTLCSADTDCTQGGTCGAPGTCVLVGATVGPFSQTGLPSDCLQLIDSITFGTSFVGAVNFFDSALGDLAVGISLGCQ